MDIFRDILLSLLIAIVTAYVTVVFSLKKFYRQKWWEAKLKSYSKVIEIISSLQYYFGREWEWATTSAMGLSEIELKQLRQDYEKNMSSLKKIVISASFLISKESLKTLKDLIATLDAIKEEWVLSTFKKRGAGDFDPFPFQPQYEALDIAIKVINGNIQKELSKK